MGVEHTVKLKEQQNWEGSQYDVASRLAMQHIKRI
jgi:hypothetical protein